MSDKKKDPDNCGNLFCGKHGIFGSLLSEKDDPVADLLKTLEDIAGVVSIREVPTHQRKQLERSAATLASQLYGEYEGQELRPLAAKQEFRTRLMARFLSEASELSDNFAVSAAPYEVAQVFEQILDYWLRAFANAWKVMGDMSH